MVVRCAGAEGQDLSVTGAQRDALKQQAEKLTLDTILAGLDVLVAAKNRMRFTSHSRVLLEIALVRIAQLDDLVPISQLAEWVAREGSAPAPRQAGAPANPAKPAVSPTPGEKKNLSGADE